MREKLAIVLEGSAMRSVYSAGAVFGLAKGLGQKNPDMVVSSSGGCGTALYYVSGQYKSIKNIWTNLLQSKKFVNPFRFWKILDVDYLIDVVFKKQDTLNMRKVIDSKIKLFVGVTDYATGKAHYFSNRSEKDMYSSVRASKSAPPLFLREIRIRGKRYIDGQLSCSLEKNIQKAIDEGATKIIAIKNHERGLVNHLTFNLIGLFFPSNLRKTIFDYANNKFKHDSGKKVPVFYLGPSKKITMGAASNSAEDLNYTFNLGYKDVTHNKKLKKFLK